MNKLTSVTFTAKSLCIFTSLTHGPSVQSIFVDKIDNCLSMRYRNTATVSNSPLEYSKEVVFVAFRSASPTFHLSRVTLLSKFMISHSL
jgi:hypothetical protein